MSVATLRSPDAWTRSLVGVRRVTQSALAVSVSLYAFAFAFRLWTVGLISFPLTEGSAYYVAVARNIVALRGLVIDSIWSYATPPLTLPRPAFELWQPVASVLAVVPMAFNSPSFAAAQLGAVVLGSLLAPLAWLVGRDTARRLELPERRAWFVAVGAGALAAVAGPFLLATAVPDSTLPFTLFAVGACLVMPAALAGDRRALIGLGALLGLAYLTRMEAVWIGLAFVAMLVANRVGWSTVVRRSAGVASVVALVAAPWWLRNLSVFGSPFPGQVADNVFFTRNEQVYSYLDRPTLDGFLAQGVPQMAAHVGQAFWHQLVDVLLVPSAPLVVVGLTTVAFAAWKRRSRAAALGRVRSGTLAAVLISGAITFLATAVLFPIATLWGTFEHAAGPLLVGLTVTAVVGGDAFVAWLVRRRHWARQNAWLAPAALVALTLPLTVFVMRSAGREATAEKVAIASVAAALPDVLAAAGIDERAPLITDRPIWLSDALNRPTLALPDEPPASVLELARRFGAAAVVVVEGRGRYPAELANGGASCFAPLPSAGGATVFMIETECLQ